MPDAEPARFCFFRLAECSSNLRPTPVGHPVAQNPETLSS